VSYVTARLPRSASAYARRDVPLLVALAELRERRRERLLAADAYQEVLKLEPEFRYAIRGQVLALNNAGLVHLANRLAEKHSDAFSDEEKRRLAHDAAARTVIFSEAQRDTGHGPVRFATTDVGLMANREVDARFGEEAISQFDRLVALRDRVRMQEVVALYQSMVQNKLNVPAYAKVAAADAYLYLEQPEVARDLYREAINAARGDGGEGALEWQVALMYAYSEAEQHDEAQALADKLKADTPLLVDKGVASLESPNDEYSKAALTSARLRLYSGRLEQAEKRLAELRALAPFNSGVRASWASLQSAREKPRAALDEFTMLQVDDPKSIDAAVGRGESLLALNQFEEARQVLGPLVESYPHNKAVQNLARKMSYHDGLTLQIDTTLGHGGSIAGAESLVDTKLYSMPLKNSFGEPYRVFAHVSRSEGETTDGSSIARTRVGAGMEYRVRDLTIEGEVNHAVSSPDINGIALTMSCSLSDTWRTSVFVDTNVNDLPAAAYQNGVTAKTIGASVTWVDNESRSAGAYRAHAIPTTTRAMPRVYGGTSAGFPGRYSSSTATWVFTRPPTA